MAGNKGIQGKDLEALNQLYQHEKSYRDQHPQGQPEDLRSLKSEYDYGAKKKFVDVLGNIKKTDNGLKGLEMLRNHPGAKNMEGQSLRSNRSRITNATSARRKLSKLQAEAGDVQPIQELEEGEPIDLSKMVLFDNEGN